MSMNLEYGFIFDGVSSAEVCDLKVLQVEGSPDSDTLATSVSHTKVSAVRSSKSYILQAKDNDPLTFKLQIFPMKKKFFNLEDLNKISNWLFTKRDYKKLQFLSPALSHLYYNCILLEPTKLMAAEEVYGIEFTVECDANGAWEFPKTYRYKFTKPINRFNLYNNSTELQGSKPVIKVTKIGDGYIMVKNRTTNQQVDITSLNDGEIITMDCDKQIIESSLNRYMYDDFNCEFLVLEKGQNLIEVMGECDIEFTVQSLVKVGG